MVVKCNTQRVNLPLLTGKPKRFAFIVNKNKIALNYYPQGAKKLDTIYTVAYLREKKF